MDVSEEFRIEETLQRFLGLEGPHPTEYLATVIAGHPHRGYLSGLLINVQIRRTIHGGASVTEVYGTLCVVRKAREKILANFDHLVRLSTRTSHFACD
jgi:hypothetical protein